MMVIVVIIIIASYMMMHICIMMMIALFKNDGGHNDASALYVRWGKTVLNQQTSRLGKVNSPNLGFLYFLVG